MANEETYKITYDISITDEINQMKNQLGSIRQALPLNKSGQANNAQSNSSDINLSLAAGALAANANSMKMPAYQTNRKSPTDGAVDIKKLQDRLRIVMTQTASKDRVIYERDKQLETTYTALDQLRKTSEGELSQLRTAMEAQANQSQTAISLHRAEIIKLNTSVKWYRDRYYAMKNRQKARGSVIQMGRGYARAADRERSLTEMLNGLPDDPSTALTDLTKQNENNSI